MENSSTTDSRWQATTSRLLLFKATSRALWASGQMPFALCRIQLWIASAELRREHLTQTLLLSTTGSKNNRLRETRFLKFNGIFKIPFLSLCALYVRHHLALICFSLKFPFLPGFTKPHFVTIFPWFDLGQGHTTHRHREEGSKIAQE